MNINIDLFIDTLANKITEQLISHNNIKPMIDFFKPENIDKWIEIVAEKVTTKLGNSDNLNLSESDIEKLTSMVESLQEKNGLELPRMDVEL